MRPWARLPKTGPSQLNHNAYVVFVLHFERRTCMAVAMASILINKKLLRDERLLMLMEASGRGRAELIGILALFWLATREDNVGLVHPTSIKAYLPLAPIEAEAMGVYLLQAGYLLPEDGGERYQIADNVKALSNIEARQAIARKAGLASAAKRAKKSRKKRVVTEAAAPQQEMTASATPAVPAAPITSLSVRAWQVYAEAYHYRWGTLPISNATVRGQMAAIVKRIGERAIEVMPFYVAHNDSYYVLKHHPVGLALKDCESLATQCAMHRPVTSQDVRSAEKEYGYRKQLENIRAGRI
jgi:hypothetical protein